MEGVGARLGRSSTRYGPTTVFSGPVRKWKKRWIHVSPSNNNNNHSNQNHHHHNNNNVVNGSTANGNNGSHLLLYKWTPLIQKDGSNNNSNGNVNSNGEKSSAKDDTTPEEEPPRRKFKYIPIAVLEEQKKASEIEAAENPGNEAKPADTEANTAEPIPRTGGFGEKPDINDVPMEENQVNQCFSLFPFNCFGFEWFKYFSYNNCHSYRPICTESLCGLMRKGNRSHLL
ncbi:hypothetical protein Dsin_012870 [Dipteronia sinensis]|uniref:Uncharacterized protein n=1 Tax=Dipteronia sinensis TaxID=43782 RepID=A0AAE0AJQ1_9ROSI|nr:hypothetical protein Dsin_012870 [Dipteronia sinensis]